MLRENIRVELFTFAKVVADHYIVILIYKMYCKNVTTIVWESYSEDAYSNYYEE